MSDLGLKITNVGKHLSQVNSDMNNPRDKKRAAEVSKQFESLLTTMMLKSMMPESNGMFGEEGFGGDYFESIFQQEIATHMSKGKGLGVADMIYQKITGEKLDKTPVKIERVIPPPIKSPKLSLGTENTSPIKPSTQSLDRLSKYDPIIDRASAMYGIDKNLIKSVILAESAAKEDAISSAKAKGLMQLMDSTADYLGVKNSWNPQENIFGGTKYLAELLRKYNGELKFALAGYNAGPGNVDKYKGIPPFAETQSYVKRVMGYLNHFEKSV